MASAQYRCGGGVATRQRRRPEARSDLHCPAPACGLFGSLAGRGLVGVPIVEWSLDSVTIQNLDSLSDIAGRRVGTTLCMGLFLF